ncbi:MAG: T9SS type A sorting domain-containing protein [Bacteroidota bacterium]|nr:T9SS type A sorting domain-containing protein [Bacteroidota bacterium]
MIFSTKALFISTAFLLLASGLFAQSAVNQVIIVSGGNFSDPADMVKIGAYTPDTKTYTFFDSLSGDFASGAIADANYVYLSVGYSGVDTKVFKYNLDNYERLDSVVIPGVVRLAVHGDNLIATQGFGAAGAYLSIYDKNDLTLKKSFPEVNMEARGIAVSGNKAYIGITGSWPDFTDTATIAVIDLSTLMFTEMIYLDDSLKIVNELFAGNGNLYVQGEGGITGVYNIATGSHTLVHTGGSNTFAFYDDELYQAFDSGIGAYDVAAGTVQEDIVSRNFYHARLDTAGGLIYFTQSDFTTYGTLFVADRVTGVLLDSVEVGIAPEAIAIQYMQPTGIAEGIITGIKLYPQPAADKLYIDMPGDATYYINDITGRTVTAGDLISGITELNVAAFPPGVYFLNIHAPGRIAVQKFLMQ